MKPTLLITLFVALLVAPAAFAVGPPSIDALQAEGPQKPLEALDKRHNHYPTQVWTFKMVVQPKGGSSRTLKFKVWQKGNKRLVRFLEPGEVKGMSVLSKGTEKMWVYSQETGGKARLVASSAKRQALLGSDVTFDDMATVDFSVNWNATIAKDEGGFVWLDLAPKEGAEVSWSALKMRVSKKTAMIDTIEYVDAGKVKKIQTRKRFGVVDGTPVYQEILMETQATGHQTTLDMLEQKIGEELPDNLFSKRSLIRGN